MTEHERPVLSRPVIAKAALRLTDQGGLSALSMRKLGGALGVEAMSLYHYVANKDDLLDAVLDELYAEIQLPYDSPDGDWETAVREGLQAFHRVLTTHPGALELFSSRPVPSEQAFGVLTWAYQRFTNVGVDVTQAQHALHFAVSYVMGQVATASGVLSLAPKEEERLTPEELSDPEAADFLRKGREIGSEEMFAAGLDIVIDGLRTRYDLP